MSPTASAGDAKRMYNTVFFIHNPLMASPITQKKSHISEKDCQSLWDLVGLDFQLSFLFKQQRIFWTLFHISSACVEAPSFVVLHFYSKDL